MSPFDSRYLPQRPLRISNTSQRGEEERDGLAQASAHACVCVKVLTT